MQKRITIHTKKKKHFVNLLSPNFSIINPKSEMPNFSPFFPPYLIHRTTSDTSLTHSIRPYSTTYNFINIPKTNQKKKTTKQNHKMNDRSMIRIATEEDIHFFMLTKRENNNWSLKERMTKHLQLPMSLNLHREVVS